MLSSLEPLGRRAATFAAARLRRLSGNAIYEVMQEQFVETYLGVHTTDAERVEIAFSGGNLQIRYLDWQEQPRELLMPQTLAFRWQDDEDGSAPRDDTTYEVTGSTWLKTQLERSALSDDGRFRHYKLCFNACGTLDVICHAIEVDRG